MVHALLNRPLRAAVLATAAAAAALPSAHALTFNFTDVGATPMDARFYQAFQAAGQYWSGLISDPVTINLEVSFAALPSGVLGSTSSNYVGYGYANVRTALVGDATTATDASAVANLQAGPSLSFRANGPSPAPGQPLPSYFDNDGSLNNSTLAMTQANAKAIGLLPGNAAGADAVITFATGFIPSFVTGRTGSVPAGMLDFDTVARHEIAHVLGFTSGVDIVDFCAAASNPCGLGAAGFNDQTWFMPLDLFRYSAGDLPGTFVLDARVGGSPYFSVDGGVTAIEPFSTGVTMDFGGDGWQASHFGPGSTTLMRAFLQPGEFYDAQPQDLTALDAIGWDLVTAVPEPSTWALMGLGLAGLAARTRRRQAG